MNLVIGENNQISTDIPKEDMAISFQGSYLELGFQVSQGAISHDAYADGDHLRSVKLGRSALFDTFNLIRNTGKKQKKEKSQELIG